MNTLPTLWQGYLRHLRMQSELKQRTIVGGSIISLLTLLIVYLPHPSSQWLFALTIALLCFVAMQEYFAFALRKHIQVATEITFLCVVLYLSALVFYPYSKHIHYLVFLGSLLLLFAAYARQPKNAVLSIAVTLFSFIYIAWPLCCLYEIVYLLPPLGAEQGRWFLLYLLFVTKSVDLGGYFAGKKIWHPFAS